MWRAWSAMSVTTTASVRVSRMLKSRSVLAIEVARMMFYYGAGVVMEKGFKNPIALPLLAAELRDCDLAQAGRKLSERHKQ